MQRLKDAWAWLRLHWYLPLTAILAVGGVVLGALLQRNALSPRRRLQTEMEAIDAGAKTAEVVLAEGHEKAKEMVLQNHREITHAMDDAAKAKAKKLLDNPVALSKHLVRTGAELRARPPNRKS